MFLRVAAGNEAAAFEGLGEVARKGGRPGLVIDGVPPGALSAELMARISRLLVDLGDSPPAADVDQLAYAVKLRLTAARARAPREIALGIAGPPAVVSALLARDLGPYVDFIVWKGTPASARAGHEVWQLLARAPDDPGSLDAAVQAARAPGVDRWLWEMPADAGRAAVLVADLARASALMPRGLVPSATVAIACGGVPAGAYLNPLTLETIALARACPPGAAVTVTPFAPGVERVTLATGDAIVRVPAPGAQDRFAEGVQVVGSRELAVEEIVARHQAAAARQAAAVRDLISRGALTLSFEAPGFPAPVVISSDAVIYASAGVTELEQRAVRVNGIEFRGGSVPRLPIIEPERVASPPLAITLTGVYRYRLAGREQVAGTSCYVVAFEPIDRARLALSRARVDCRGQFRDGEGRGRPDRIARADRRLGAGRRVPRSAGRRLAAGPVRRASDVRRRGASHADPSRAGDRDPRDQPAGFSRAAAGRVRVGRRDASRHAAGVSVPARGSAARAGQLRRRRLRSPDARVASARSRQA